MVDVPEVLQRSWLIALGDRARRDRLPAGGVLAAVAATCAASCPVVPGRTPLLAGAFGDPLPWSEVGPEPDAMLLGPDLVGQVAEVLTAPEVRRRGGVHHTPPELADRLTAAVIGPGAALGSVCDPSVGGGAFLLAAARRMVGAAASVRAVVERLAGVDVEPLAVAAAEAGLALFAAERGVTLVPSGLVVADALGLPAGRFPLRPGAGYDVVIGNPPFGGQLKEVTRASADERAARKARFGGAAGAYTDRSALFLLLALELVRDGGRVQLVLPRSILVARDAGAVRRQVRHVASLDAVWVDRDGSFDAAVGVCALTATRGGGAPATSVAVGWDRPAITVGQPAEHDEGWGALLAAAAGVPSVDPDGPALGSIAAATAGFREQYYGLVPFVRERADGGGMPLVTSGLIEPAELLWGRVPCRFARRRWDAPVVDRRAVADADVTLGDWVEARRRPKILVASQTRVIEAVVDVDGRLLPSVPVVSVEPADPANLWRVAAALLSPVATAWLLHHRAGSGLSDDTIRVSARSVTELPLPTDHDCWAEAAELVERWHDDPSDRGRRRRFAAAAIAAYEPPPAAAADLGSWWEEHVERSVRA